MAEAGYDLLTTASVADYVRRRPRLAARLAQVNDVREVGDGNLNLVFIVSGSDSAGAPASLVLKQALPYVRADPSWPMTPTRNHAEARALRVHGELAGSTVPTLYDADPQQFTFAVEDLSDHRVWRSALNDGQRHDGAAEALGRYVADVAFGTSLLGIETEQLKANVADAVNPALCHITELLVFTEPYTAAGRATVAEQSLRDVTAYADDPDVIEAIGVAKWHFMTNSEALIHGDLHTGSVMVREGSTKAFDSEFAFYGPVGFDLGLLWANLVLAAARSAVLGQPDEVAWRLAQPVRAWEAFVARFHERWPERVDPDVFTDRIRDRYLGKVQHDAFDAAAAETARRVIGPYPVADIETLDEQSKAAAVRAVLAASRHFLLDEAARNGDVAAAFDSVGNLLS